MRTLIIFTLISSIGFSQAEKHYPPIPFDSTLYQNKQQLLQQPTQPNVNAKNIILIVADDLGKYDISCYGNPYIKTPHIDQLAKDGVLYDQSYATAAVCSPSRAGFMTGRYQQRFGYHVQPHQRYPKNKFELWAFQHLINTNDLHPEDFAKYPSKENIAKAGLPQSELTISELLKTNGYKTAWIGKWHLGYTEPLLPKNFGFDYRYGCLEAYTLFANPKDKTIVNAKIKEFTDKVIWKGGRKDACAIRENEVVIDEKEYITYAFFNRAKQFIGKNISNPFFVYLPITAPHTPYQAPKEIYDQLTHISDHNKRVYYSMIIALDNAIGELITYLKSNNLYDNTLIIFTSDNGAALYTNTIDNKPLNGGKFTFFEGGINVPLIIKNDISTYFDITKINAPVSLLDLFPTIADAANIPLPSDRTYDGISLLQYNTNEKILEKRNTLYWYSDYNAAIRQGNEKLILNSLDNTVDFYNLATDPYELNNISTPNATSLKLNLLQWMKKMPPMYWPRIMNYELIINGKKYRWAV